MPHQQHFNNALSFILDKPEFFISDKAFQWPKLGLDDASKQAAFIQDLEQTSIETAQSKSGKPQRLGNYYEDCWQHVLNQHPTLSLLRHNWQIIDNKQTLGEFDFILAAPNNKPQTTSKNISACEQAPPIIHLEVAIKFYLNGSRLFHGPLQAENNSQYWLGPSATDNLYRKFKHIHHKQLCLPQLPAAKAALQSQQLFPVESQYSFKGYLFDDWLLAKTKPAPDVSLNKDDLHAQFNHDVTHLWAYTQAWPDFWQWFTQLGWVKKAANNTTLTLCYIPKTQWISNAHPIDAIEVIAQSNDATDDLTQWHALDMNAIYTARSRFHESPLMFALCEASPCGKYRKELERFFLAPDVWPC